TRGVDIVGVSFDDPARNAEFVKAEGFPFRLLSDQSHGLAMSVGAADSADAPVARRISYLVGPDGTVRQVYTSVNPARHAKDVLGAPASPCPPPPPPAPSPPAPSCPPSPASTRRLFTPSTSIRRWAGICLTAAPSPRRTRPSCCHAAWPSSTARGTGSSAC